MCTSLIVKPLFVIGIGLSLALVAVALFTPGWAKYTDEEGDTVKVGLVTRNCGSNSSSVKSVSSACKDYFNSRPSWEKAVIALLGISMIILIVILAWSVISCVAFCLPGCFPVQTILTALACGCITAAVIVFGSKYKNFTTSFANITITTNVTKDIDQLMDLNYSFWLAVVAAVITAGLTLLGALAALIETVSPF